MHQKGHEGDDEDAFTRGLCCAKRLVDARVSQLRWVGLWEVSNRIASGVVEFLLNFNTNNIITIY